MGESLALEGLQEARALGLRRAEGLMLNTLTIVAFMRGDLAAGLEWNQQSLRISRESNDRQGEAIDLANCGGTWLDLGNFSEAASDLEEALRLARVVGARQAESSILSNLSRLAWQQGHNAQARAHALAALEIARAMQAKDGEVLYLWNLGTAELGLDHFAEALETFSESLTLAQSIESAWQLDATAGLARTALAMGDHANALSHVETLLAHFDAGGTVGGTEAPRLVHLTCYQVLEAAGDARARAILEKAKDELLARAATITDASLRQSFLHNITEHREILAIWTAKMPG
jgi:tetratricopeptide (TPR) repeat protein